MHKDIFHLGLGDDSSFTLGQFLIELDDNQIVFSLYNTYVSAIYPTSTPEKIQKTIKEI